MKRIHVNFDFGMILGLGIIITLVLTATVARVIYGPNSPIEETVEEIILKKFNIDVEFSPEDEKVYEIIIDKKTGNRVIREKKESIERAVHVLFTPRDLYPMHRGICFYQTPAKDPRKTA